MDIFRLINNMVRVGTISSINQEKFKARVIFEDRDNLVTKELPILNKRNLQLGDQVICLFLPNGLEEGFILGYYIP